MFHPISTCSHHKVHVNLFPHLSTFQSAIIISHRTDVTSIQLLPLLDPRLWRPFAPLVVIAHQHVRLHLYVLFGAFFPTLFFSDGAQLDVLYLPFSFLAFFFKNRFLHLLASYRGRLVCISLDLLRQ